MLFLNTESAKKNPEHKLFLSTDWEWTEGREIMKVKFLTSFSQFCEGLDMQLQIFLSQSALKLHNRPSLMLFPLSSSPWAPPALKKVEEIQAMFSGYSNTKHSI